MTFVQSSSPRDVLTCAYKNRRRNRASIHPNIINNNNNINNADNNNNNNNTMNSQTSKPTKLSLTPLKIRKDNTYKLSMNEEEVSENIEDWQTLLSKDNNKLSSSLKILSVESASSLEADNDDDDDELLCCDINPSIFRRMADYDNQDDMMVLKRANPVYDSSDDYADVPSKRQRTTGETTVLQWGERLEEDATEGFCLMNLLRD
ncbi:MAG: hypothetical protein ACI8RD_001469 [Bacillariaceae sp.]|jgi:hypothetical protein